MGNIRTFKSMLAGKGRNGSGGNDQTIIRQAKLAKRMDAEIQDSERLLNRVYVAFNKKGKSFSAEEVHRTIAGLDRLDSLLRQRQSTVLASLRTAIRADVKADRLVAQNEEIAILRAKSASLRAVAEASLPEGTEFDDEVILDDSEFLVEDDTMLGDEVPVEGSDRKAELPPPMPDENTTFEEPAPEFPHVGSDDDEDDADDVEFSEDLDSLDSVTEEILDEEEMLPVEDEEDEVAATVHARRNRKMRASSRRSGGVRQEKDILSSIMDDFQI